MSLLSRVWLVCCRNNGLGHASKTLAWLSKWYMSPIRLSTVPFVLLLRIWASIHWIGSKIPLNSGPPAFGKLWSVRFYLGPGKVMIQSSRPSSKEAVGWRHLGKENLIFDWLTDAVSCLQSTQLHHLLFCSTHSSQTLYLHLLCCLPHTMWHNF